MLRKHQIVIWYRCPGFLEEEGLTVEEVALRSGVPPSFVHRLLELGIIEYKGRFNEPRFSCTVVPKIRRIVRLRRDLGINWAGLGLIMDLLDEIDYLRRKIKKYENN